MRLFFTIVILIGSLFLQHIIHELSHVMAAKLWGVKIKKIQWFTYSKFFGTRVFYESEPNFQEEDIEAKWGFIAIAGLLVTTVLGYLALILYIIGKNHFSSLSLLILFMVAIIFILMDSYYFFVGSWFEFGDISGFRRTFHFSKASMVSSSMCFFMMNLLLVNHCLWS